MIDFTGRIQQAIKLSFPVINVVSFEPAYAQIGDSLKPEQRSQE